MQDLVSTRWIRASGVAASLALAGAIPSFSGSSRMPGISLVWVSLAGLISIWLSKRSTRSVAQSIAILELKPVPVTARGLPFGRPASNIFR
jgi:hypothetical protein